jgi:tyramine---L-glutamate ligase
MRILVHEFVSGGGLAGRPVPRSLGREGSAMLAALVADLAAIGGHQIVTTSDPRFPLSAPAGVDVVVLPSNRAYPRNLDPLISTADAVWLIAPESQRCLERLAARVERQGVRLLGPSASAIRAVSDKARLARVLRLRRISHPVTRAAALTLPARAVKSRLNTLARLIGYPMVTKPARGAGSEGVWLVRDADELRLAAEALRRTESGARLVLQQHVRGVAASVSLLAAEHRTAALAVNAQRMRAGRPFAYQGGATPLDHPLAGLAAETAVRACEAFPGLRGYIGVDMVLTGSDAVVIEINPRLTTAYLGVRQVVDENVAALAIAASSGRLPAMPAVRRSVRFFSDGRIAS